MYYRSRVRRGWRCGDATRIVSRSHGPRQRSSPSLIRANPSKDGDAESRDYGDATSLGPPGRQRNDPRVRAGGCFFLPSRDRDVTIKERQAYVVRVQAVVSVLVESIQRRVFY